MALGEKPVVAGGALPSLSEGLVTGRNLVQVLVVIIVIARGAQELEGEVANERRGPVVHKEELPLEAVTRGELGLTRMDHWKLPDQLRRHQPPRRHEDSLVAGRAQPVGGQLGDRAGLDGYFVLLVRHGAVRGLGGVHPLAEVSWQINKSNQNGGIYLLNNLIRAGKNTLLTTLC